MNYILNRVRSFYTTEKKKREREREKERTILRNGKITRSFDLTAGNKKVAKKMHSFITRNIRNFLFHISAA